MERLLRYVPHHLRRTYPAVFAIILANTAILFYPGIVFNYKDIVNDTWAGVTSGLLIYGWISNNQRHTFTGLWLSVGLWANIIVNLWVDEGIGFGTIQLTLFCFSYLVLSFGAWWLMRIDPNVSVSHSRKTERSHE